LTIDSSGNVGIGTTSPESLSLHGALTVAGNSGGKLFLNSNGAPTRNCSILATAGAFIFDTADSATPILFRQDGSEAARFNSSGNLVFPNGQGIDFSASTGPGDTSSLLDDYEEGIFQTSMSPISGTVTISSSEDTLGYIKIGRLVHVQGRIGVGSVSSASGALLEIQLPFAATTGTELSGQSAGAVMAFGNSSGAGAGFTIRVNAGTNNAFIEASDGQGAQFDCNKLTSSSGFRIGFVYTASS